MRTVQLRIGSGIVDERELDAGLSLDRGDLAGRDVILEVDEDVVRIREGGDPIGRLLRFGVARIGLAAEVPVEEHERDDDEQPEDLAEARTALRLGLFVHDDQYRSSNQDPLVRRCFVLAEHELVVDLAILGQGFEIALDFGHRGNDSADVLAREE